MPPTPPSPLTPATAALPEDFGKLASLHRLGLKSNQLVELPSSFTALTSLVELFITDNALLGFPQGMGNMQSLVKLQASFNKLREVSHPPGAVHTYAGRCFCFQQSSPSAHCSLYPIVALAISV